jgi:hypothetical protein
LIVAAVFALGLTSAASAEPAHRGALPSAVQVDGLTLAYANKKYRRHRGWSHGRPYGWRHDRRQWAMYRAPRHGRYAPLYYCYAPRYYGRSR